ncbi:MAG TPA: VCBS repeat-containing protein, partial [bacterium]|nr:VCBS repeat-containing protein [bacterium]
MDPVSLSVEAEIPWPHSIEDACIADYDDDGDPDLFLNVEHEESIRVFDLTSWSFLHVFPYEPMKMSVAQVDNDIQKELIFNAWPNNQGGYVVDLRTHEIEWAYYPCFGKNFIPFDVDLDGKDELVCLDVSDDGLDQVLDVDTRSVKWEKLIRCGLQACCGDFDGDGSVELINGCAFIHCYRAVDGEFLWQMGNDYFACVSMTSGDIDLDGQIEIIESGNDRMSLSVIDPLNREIEWFGPHWPGSSRNFDIGDIDNSGTMEIILAANYEEMQPDVFTVHRAEAFVLDAITHRPLKKVPINITHQESGSIRVNSVFLEDLEPGMPGLELGVIAYNFIVINVMTQLELWRSEIWVDFALPYDIDGDGLLDIVAFTSNKIVIFNAQTSEIKAEYRPSYYPSVLQAEIADIDEDGISEIGMLGPLNFTILNGASEEIDYHGYDPCIECFDFGDAYPETPGIEVLYAAEETTTKKSTVTIIDGINHSIITKFGIPIDEEIRSIKVVDINQDGEPEILVTTENYILCRNRSGGTIIWMDYIGEVNKYSGKTICSDINNDGVNEVLVGTSFALHEYRHGGTASDPGPDCDVTGIRLSLPDHMFSQYDPFYLDVTVCNASEYMLDYHHVFILLEIFGDYYCLPDWVNISTGISSYHQSIPPGSRQFMAIQSFGWP